MEVTFKKWQARLTVEKVQNIKDGIAAVASCRVANWGKAQKIEDILKTYKEMMSPILSSFVCPTPSIIQLHMHDKGNL